MASRYKQNPQLIQKFQNFMNVAYFWLPFDFLFLCLWIVADTVNVVFDVPKKIVGAWIDVFKQFRPSFMIEREERREKARIEAKNSARLVYGESNDARACSAAGQYFIERAIGDGVIFAMDLLNDRNPLLDDENARKELISNGMRALVKLRELWGDENTFGVLGTPPELGLIDWNSVNGLRYLAAVTEIARLSPSNIDERVMLTAQTAGYVAEARLAAGIAGRSMDGRWLYESFPGEQGPQQYPYGEVQFSDSISQSLAEMADTRAVQVSSSREQQQQAYEFAKNAASDDREATASRSAERSDALSADPAAPEASSPTPSPAAPDGLVLSRFR